MRNKDTFRISHPRVGVKAVNRRAKGLTVSYAGKAKKVDWQYCGTPRPLLRKRGSPPVARVVGPVETRLLSYRRISGWVFGARGECSDEVHNLVQRIARARLEVDDMVVRWRGAPKSKEAKLAQHVGYIRRRLYFTA